MIECPEMQVEAATLSHILALRQVCRRHDTFICVGKKRTWNSYTSLFGHVWENDFEYGTPIVIYFRENSPRRVALLFHRSTTLTAAQSAVRAKHCFFRRGRIELDVMLSPAEGKWFARFRRI
ncbi:hypothetical protein CEXT_70811 [Caerostris extrusa]|uniref:Uncharacterized protein n=1 Tax=Caerostris extrusa TaxID=172846 RepID=A0AAV4YG82_CAEEX|nr:hypothetical protein CEXT_70811 [Caerostris extrusa]